MRIRIRGVLTLIVGILTAICISTLFVYKNADASIYGNWYDNTYIVGNGGHMDGMSMPRGKHLIDYNKLHVTHDYMSDYDKPWNQGSYTFHYYPYNITRRNYRATGNAGNIHLRQLSRTKLRAYGLLNGQYFHRTSRPFKNKHQLAPIPPKVNKPKPSNLGVSAISPRFVRRYDYDTRMYGKEHWSKNFVNPSLIENPDKVYKDLRESGVSKGLIPAVRDALSSEISSSAENSYDGFTKVMNTLKLGGVPSQVIHNIYRHFIWHLSYWTHNDGSTFTTPLGWVRKMYLKPAYHYFKRKYYVFSKRFVRGLTTDGFEQVLKWGIDALSNAATDALTSGTATFAGPVIDDVVNGALSGAIDSIISKSVDLLPIHYRYYALRV